MKSLTPLFILGIFFVVYPAFADFNVKDWKYEKTIQLPQLSSASFVEVSFDEDVFSKAASGLRDLRVMRGSEERPYKLVVDTATVEMDRLSGRVYDINFVPGEHSSFIVDLGSAGLFHNQVEVISSSLNFRREATVEASNDEAFWSVIQPKAVIYDYTDKDAALKARNTTVRYPESTMRYLRVKIINYEEDPLIVSTANVLYEKKTQAQTVSYPASIVELSIDEEHRASRVVADLGSAGLPNNTLTLTISGDNFKRDIGLEGSKDKEKWSVIKTRDVIFSYRTPKFTGSKLAITYPESAYRYLRLTIFNKDDVPLAVKGITASGALRKLVFEAEPSGEYKLFYGNPDARYPEFDIESYFQYLAVENIGQATLGTQALNAFFVEKVPPLPPVSERFPWLFPTVLGIGIVLLAGLLFKLLFSIRKRFPPQG